LRPIVLFVAAGFAFTLVGLVAEGVAMVVLLALVVKALLAFAHGTSALRHAKSTFDPSAHSATPACSSFES
jgi:hypothetical protein